MMIGGLKAGFMRDPRFCQQQGHEICIAFSRDRQKHPRYQPPVDKNIPPGLPVDKHRDHAENAGGKVVDASVP